MRTLPQFVAKDIACTSALVAEAVRKINAEQKQELLANLPKAVEKAVDPKKVYDLDQWTSIATDAMEPIYVSLFKAETEAVAQEIDQPELDR